MPDTDTAGRPAFIAADRTGPLPERPSRRFERLVNEDIRDKFAAGPAYAVLSRRENLIPWLHTLTDIRDSIGAQNAHDNAQLRAREDRPNGGLTPQSYIDAKHAMEERKRSRERAMQAVLNRIGEVRRLIGTAPLSQTTAGSVVSRLMNVDAALRDGSITDARKELAALMDHLNEQAATDEP